MLKHKRFYYEREVLVFFEENPSYVPITIQYVSLPVFSGFFVWYKKESGDEK